MADEAEVWHLRVVNWGLFSFHVGDGCRQLLLLLLHLILHLHEQLEHLLLLLFVLVFLGLGLLCLRNHFLFLW